MDLSWFLVCLSVVGYGVFVAFESAAWVNPGGLLGYLAKSMHA